jgi:uncharacterized membrane protein YccF (DUF307 family)/uncharacterized Zn-finger protein
MAKISTLCPHCRAEVHVYTEWAGKMATCSHCGGEFTIAPHEVPFSPGDTLLCDCPACQVEQELSADGRQQFCNSCSSCGTPFWFSTRLAFRCTVKLPDDGGNKKIACPYCGAHYRLSYTPPQGLIGCQHCLNVFAAVIPAGMGNRVETVADTPEFEYQPRFSFENMAPGVPDYFANRAETVAEEPVYFASQRGNTAALETPEEYNRAVNQSNVATIIEAETVAEEPGNPMPPPPPSAVGGDGSDKKPSKVMAMLIANFGEAPATVIMSVLRLLGNVIWLVGGGLFAAVVFVFYGILLLLTVIGIPFGLQFFKLADLMLSPYGADVYRKKQGEKVGCFSAGLNVLWLIFGGLWISLVLFIVGAVYFITIIGIPVALQYFKFAKLVLTPFGLEIRRTNSMKVTYIISAVLLVVFFLIMR